MRREAAFPGFSSVSRVTGSCLVATLKGAQQVKAHESGPKHLAQRSGRACVKAQPRSGPGTEARMLGFQNSNTQAQTQAQSRAFNLTPAPPVIAVAARRADVARSSAASRWARGLSGRLRLDCWMLRLPGRGRPGSCGSAVSAAPSAGRGERAALGSPKPAQPLL